MRDCLVPASVTMWIGNIFESIWLGQTQKIPSRVQAVNMWNLLLIQWLPFLLHNLLEGEVEHYKQSHLFYPIVDPSNECIGMVILLIDWHMLFCWSAKICSTWACRLLMLLIMYIVLSLLMFAELKLSLRYLSYLFCILNLVFLC